MPIKTVKGLVLHASDGTLMSLGVLAGSTAAATVAQVLTPMCQAGVALSGGTLVELELTDGVVPPMGSYLSNDGSIYHHTEADGVLNG